MEEGGRCTRVNNTSPEGAIPKFSTCSGINEYTRGEESCSCHIHPPCRSCVEMKLECNVCGYSETDEEEDLADIGLEFEGMPTAYAAELQKRFLVGNFLEDPIEASHTTTPEKAQRIATQTLQARRLSTKEPNIINIDSVPPCLRREDIPPALLSIDYGSAELSVIAQIMRDTPLRNSRVSMAAYPRTPEGVQIVPAQQRSEQRTITGRIQSRSVTVDINRALQASSVSAGVAAESLRRLVDIANRQVEENVQAGMVGGLNEDSLRRTMEGVPTNFPTYSPAYARAELRGLTTVTLAGESKAVAVEDLIKCIKEINTPKEEYRNIGVSNKPNRELE